METVPWFHMQRAGKLGYPIFDWLRFLLASLVYWEHANVTDLISPGNFAVQVFFALSGWLIGGILLETDRSGLPRFYYNRATRIWLPYLFAVAALYLMAIAKDGFAPYFFQALAFDLTFTHNWFIQKIPSVIQALPMQGTGTHFWSISVEEQFYLAAPLLLVLTPLRHSRLAWVLIAVAAIWSGTNYAAISCGVLAVVLRRHFGDWHLAPWAAAAMAALLLTLAAAFWMGWLGYWLVAPLTAVLIVLLTARPGRRGSQGKFFGGISYPMYLNHWIGLFAASAVLSVIPQMGRVAAFGLGFLVSIGVAAAAWYVIDRNVQLHRSRFYTARRGRVCMIAAYGLMFTGILLGLVIIGPLEGAPPAG